MSSKKKTHEHKVESKDIQEPVSETSTNEVATETVPETTPTEIKSLEVVVELPKPKPLTLASSHAEILALEQRIIQLEEAVSRKRKPVESNGKIQIKDKQTGKIYPSKNNVYQSLLKAGELDDLVAKGVFGKDPAKNSFGCYALFRSYPDRFEEIKPESKPNE